MNTPVTVGLIQEAVTSDANANVERAAERVREAAARGAQIVCLQELFNAPYFCKAQKYERFDIAEPIPGPAVERMQKLAQELDVVLIVPVFERQAAGVYRNSAAIVDADGRLLPKSCFIRQRLAGILPRKKNSVRVSSKPGRPPSARMRLPTEFSSHRPIA